MLKKINIEHAELKTATVEIKSLIVNSRKLTLSTFRQIPMEAILDPQNIQLRGVPWGRVNYYWGDMNENLMHVVWQLGDELRRTLVSYFDDELADHRIRSVFNFSSDHHRDSLIKSTYDHDEGKYVGVYESYNEGPICRLAVQHLMRDQPEAAKPFGELTGWTNPPVEPEKPDAYFGRDPELIIAYDAAAAEYEDEKKEWEAEYAKWAESISELAQQANEAYLADAQEFHVAYRRRLAALNDLVAQLEALDQIFIAV